MSEQVVHKFPLNLGGWGVFPSATHNVEMPKVSQVLALQLQNDIPTLWVQVDPETPAVTRTFQWVGTGQDVPLDGKYVGTVQMKDGAYVFHLYEVTA